MKLAVIALVIASAAALPAFAQDAPLGRLFLTPQQRAALDNARRYKIRAQAVAATIGSKPRIPAARSVVINGLVQRSDGESVIWVNGKPTDGQMADGTRVTVAGDGHGSVVVREPERGRRIGLRVGQRADLLTGRVEESHERRRSQARPVEKMVSKNADAKLLEKRLEERRKADEDYDRATQNEPRDAVPAPQDKPEQ